MALALARASCSSSASLSTFLPRRLLSTTSISITRSPFIPTILPARRSLNPLSHALRSLPRVRFTPIRCRVNRSGNSAYSPLNSGSNFSDRPPTEMAPLFPGCDYEHWLIVMDKPGGESATKQQMIDCYIQTLAKVVGSEEEAKKRIYNVSCERYFGFGCELDEETSNKLGELPGVLFVLPDSYVDPENKDYGAELFVNGEIVQRSPERQRRVEPQPQRHQDRPRLFVINVFARLQGRRVGVMRPVAEPGFNVLNPKDGICVDFSNPLCPKFDFEEKEKERLMKPFRRMLIVKLMGWQLAYGFMVRKLNQIWARKGNIDVFDRENDYFSVNFQNQEDYMEALTGGPWLIANAYLNVARWRSDFNPKVAKIDYVVAWV
ncbi:hypothetical protein K1719_031107 [Acacia pycnantha]|nr:hypothetical protein K1719_031107 [Acacia pycnantha]